MYVVLGTKSDGTQDIITCSDVFKMRDDAVSHVAGLGYTPTACMDLDTLEQEVSLAIDAYRKANNGSDPSDPRPLVIDILTTKGAL